MFAKVFGQIFDSSIAEDYNCRRMFMDLLVLADSEGIVDMTPEAIARRANLPLEQVVKYIGELSKPDPLSRTKSEEGRRIVLIDPDREWGWRIVNYRHYRHIRDEEARRNYFREKQREHRAKRRKGNVSKTQVLTEVDTGGRCQISSSSSSSNSSSEKRGSKGRCTQQEAEDFCESIGLPRSDGTAMFLHWEERGWQKVKDWKATIRKWKAFDYLPSQKQVNGKQNSQFPRQMSAFEIEKRIDAINGTINRLFREDKEKNRAEINRLKDSRERLKGELIK